MSALLLHPSLAESGADQGYLEWLHHCGVERWRGGEAVFYLVFSLHISWWSGWLWAGREGDHHRWCSRAGRPGPAPHRCYYSAHCEPLSVKVSSGQTTPRTMTNKWESRAEQSEVWILSVSSTQRTEDRMSSKISIYIYFTITSLAGDSFIIEIIYRKFRGGKNILLSCSGKYFILRKYLISLET